MVIASGSDDNNNVFLRHSPRHFPDGNLVYYSGGGYITRYSVPRFLTVLSRKTALFEIERLTALLGFW